MLLFSCLFVCLIGYTSAWGRGDLEKYGSFNVALGSGLIKCNHNRTLNLDVSGMDVYFFDYPRNYFEAFAINDAAVAILSMESLDKTKKFIIFVGGFKSRIDKTASEKIQDAFRYFPNSYLIILNHWPYTNNKKGSWKSYERSVTYVHYIGKALAQMLAQLQKNGVSPKNMHCIGHSLGGQILGHTGEMFIKETGEKISRITALDPAGPCFSKSLIQEQVRSGVADYVEVYHCNAGGLGTTSVLGDVDFFVNKKGQSQPNCGMPLISDIFKSPKAATCSHRTCIDIWAATVNNPELFPAWKCNSYNDFQKGKCMDKDKTTAGFWNPGDARGVYFFSTKGYVIK